MDSRTEKMFKENIMLHLNVKTTHQLVEAFLKGNELAIDWNKPDTNDWSFIVYPILQDRKDILDAFLKYADEANVNLPIHMIGNLNTNSLPEHLFRRMVNLRKHLMQYPVGSSPVTPLYLAWVLERNHLIEVLINHGANFSTLNQNKSLTNILLATLECIIENADNPHLTIALENRFNLLIQIPDVDVNVKNAKNEYLINIALATENPSIIQKVLSKRPNLEMLPINPCHQAAKQQNYEAIIDIIHCFDADTRSMPALANGYFWKYQLDRKILFTLSLNCVSLKTISAVYKNINHDMIAVKTRRDKMSSEVAQALIEGLYINDIKKLGQFFNLIRVVNFYREFLKNFRPKFENGFDSVECFKNTIDKMKTNVNVLERKVFLHSLKNTYVNSNPTSDANVEWLPILDQAIAALLNDYYSVFALIDQATISIKIDELSVGHKKVYLQSALNCRDSIASVDVLLHQNYFYQTSPASLEITKAAKLAINQLISSLPSDHMDHSFSSAAVPLVVTATHSKLEQIISEQEAVIEELKDNNSRLREHYKSLVEDAKHKRDWEKDLNNALVPKLINADDIKAKLQKTTRENAKLEKELQTLLMQIQKLNEKPDGNAEFKSYKK